ncbi:M14 family zinc carboxypeptidase [Streptosporangium sp. NPDC051023]|uniref:M14 family zinc carboxypeptidase n=1 Tax=Streptosporangium sp. NPDC051023 TaxID=3155410 RepID=UPI00344C4DCD
MERLKQYLGRVPDASRFPTLPEIEDRLRRIHARHPETTALKVIGTSRGGRPLTMLSVGVGVARGDRHAVVTGMPHPNEPTGTLGALALGDLLAADPSLVEELGLVWHLVPCVDPDGAALNYGWYGGPYTRRHYAEHIYRPPFPEQYEWTFRRPDLDPPGLEPIPESAAVAAVIDELRPTLLITMHNGETGGLFAYVTHDLPGLVDGLGETGEATGLPIHGGPPELDVHVLGRGLFQMAEPAGGMLSSTEYALPYGTVGVVQEPPMWIHPAIADDSLSDQTLRQVHEAAQAARADLAVRMAGWVAVIRAHHDLNTTRGRGVLEQLRYVQHLNAGPEPSLESADQRCTVGYARSVAEDVLLDTLRCAGHLAALLRDESKRSPLNPEVAGVLGQVSNTLAASAEQESGLTFVGLGPAVRAHVGMALTTAALL